VIIQRTDYFGRLPGQQNEKLSSRKSAARRNVVTLRNPQKEHALQSNGALEEKLKNVKATLVTERAVAATISGRDVFRSSAVSHEEGLRHIVSAAMRILNS